MTMPLSITPRVRRPPHQAHQGEGEDMARSAHWLAIKNVLDVPQDLLLPVLPTHLGEHLPTLHNLHGVAISARPCWRDIDADPVATFAHEMERALGEDYPARLVPLMDLEVLVRDLVRGCPDLLVGTPRDSN